VDPERTVIAMEAAGPRAAATAGTADEERRFGGVARLYGAAAAAAFGATRIAVVGLGGVGSWAAEALARSGCGRLRLVDLDHVGLSNTNRQIHALDGAYGQAKVDAMAARIAAIHPAARIERFDDFVTPENVAAALAGVSVVLDCTDQVIAKAALAAHARQAGLALVMSGAGGGRVDPTRIRCGDLARAVGDPLLASVRHRLRRHHGFPREGEGAAVRFGIQAVWSDEPVRRPAPVRGPPADRAATAASMALPPEDALPGASAGAPAGLSCAGYGSVVTVTAPLGFAMAAWVLDHLAAAAVDGGQRSAVTDSYAGP
jgi:tRNA A37 threonylcarbamoyladenosine dehydratase